MIKKVKSYMASFLWSGELKSHYEAKVSWDEMCQPYKGGLGLNNLEDWNKRLVIKLIWDICRKKDTLRFKWIHMVMLKGRSTPNDCSWVWRKLLKLRSMMQPHLRYIIGDGKSTKFWYDNWHPMEPLNRKFTKKLLWSCGLNENAEVEQFIEKGTGNGLKAEKELVKSSF